MSRSLKLLSHTAQLLAVALCPLGVSAQEPKLSPHPRTSEAPVKELEAAAASERGQQPAFLLSRSDTARVLIDTAAPDELELMESLGIADAQAGAHVYEMPGDVVKRLQDAGLHVRSLSGVIELRATRVGEADGASQDDPAPIQLLDSGTRTLTYDGDYFIPDQDYCWVSWARNDTLPSNAKVTGVGYWVKVMEEDLFGTDFYCSDYIISISSQQHGYSYTFCKVWDRDGARYDNNEDDDSANDLDIELDRRSSSELKHNFDGEDARQAWYGYVGDFAAGDDGKIDWFYIYVSWSSLEATIWDAWWTSEVDLDGDGYKRSARLNWDPDVAGGSGSLSVYEKVYRRPSANVTWEHVYTSPVHTITDASGADAQYKDFSELPHNQYEWKIEVYRNGESSPDDTRDHTDDSDLNDYKMETAAEDAVLTATIYNAWWTNEVDEDGDGYKRSARLNWDPDVAGGSGSLGVYEKIYWKYAGSSTWNLITTTSTHTITGTTSADAQYRDYSGGSHSEHDWKIEIYRSGYSSPDYARDPSNDSDLNDYRMETAAEDTLTATIYNAWWTNEVDHDGDGYKSSARLNWDPNVVGGAGSITVYEKIYRKLASSSTWTSVETTPSYVITGTSTADIQYKDIAGPARGFYDWKIEIYRSGQSSLDYARDPSNDSDLNDYPMEQEADDPTWIIMYYFANGNGDFGNEIEEKKDAINSASGNTAFQAFILWDTVGGTDQLRKIQEGDDQVWTGPEVGLPAEFDMGDPATMVTFVQWVRSHYAAARYALVVFGHGNGVADEVPVPAGEEAPIEFTPLGMCFDSDPAGSYLSVHELGLAMSSIKASFGRNLEVLHLDACWMQMFEVHYELPACVDYVVGSENVSWASWSLVQTLTYEDDYLNDITAETSASSLAVGIAQAYHEFYSDHNLGHTVSVVACAPVLAIAGKVDDLAVSLINAMFDVRAELMTVRDNVQSFDYPFYDGECDQFDAYLDLKDVAIELGARSSSSSVRAAAASLAGAIGDEGGAYIRLEYHVNGDGTPGADGWWDFGKGTYGVSVYWPFGFGGNCYSNYMDTSSSGSQLAFCVATRWDEFLQAWLQWRALKVTSSGASGVSITCTDDKMGYGSGATPFTRVYEPAVEVGLSAPTSAAGKAFVRWERNGSVYSTNRTISFAMGEDYHLNAVYGEAPGIARTPTSLTNSCQQGANAPDQAFEVWNGGSGTLSYTITDNAGWLSCSPSSGTSAGEHDTITVHYTTSSLAAGTYGATITITDPNASNNPQTVGVSLIVAEMLCVYVDDNGPNDPGPGDPSISDPDEDGSTEHPYDAIQDGIDAAQQGADVVVLSGTYTGAGNRDLDFQGKAITVRSEDGPETCIIDCEGAGRGFFFQSGETADSVVDGLTIRNGASFFGGGVYCLSSSPTITRCVISGNSAPAGGLGGGICCDTGSSPTVRDCTISGNSAPSGGIGGGICCWLESNPTITGCVISGNSARDGGGVGAICCLDFSNPTVNNCMVIDNSADYYGAIACAGSSNLTMANCTIARNSCEFGAYTVELYDDSGVSMIGCILWNNTQSEAYLDIPTLGTLDYCDVRGGWDGAGSNNINGDPLLTSDGHLSLGSPCIDWCPSGSSTDLDGEARPVDVPGVGNDGADTYDIGADEFVDSDGDWLSDAEELLLGLDPSNPDTDDDEFTDGYEHIRGSDPDDPFSTPPTDFYVSTAGDDDAGDGSVGGPWRTISHAIRQAVGSEQHPVRIHIAAGTYVGSLVLDGNPSFLGYDGYESLLGGYSADFSSRNVVDRGNPAFATIIEPRLFGETRGIALDNSGNIYVADSGNGRIQKLSPEGVPLAQWGGYGSGPGQFLTPGPCGIALDNSGNIYAADSGNCRIQKLSPEGAPLAQWGGYGCPYAVALDGAGNIYVADTFGDRIQKLSPEGVPLDQWGSSGSEPGQFLAPSGITVDSAGNMYVVDLYNYRVQKLSPNGEVLAVVGAIGSEGAGSVIQFVGLGGSAGLIEGLTIQNGSADCGGGVLCHQSDPTISNCTIADNLAWTFGGGIACVESCATITNCTVSRNDAVGWEVPFGGGGICCYGGNPSVTNCTITGNGGTQGGGIACVGTDLNITDCAISGNRAEGGGGVCCYESSPTISHCAIRGNSALVSGGGIISWSSSATITNCTISGNWIVYPPPEGGDGGGISCWYGSPTVTSCTIAGNRSYESGGGIASHGSSVTIANCILWGDTAPEAHEIELCEGASLTVTYSDVQSGQAGVYVETGCSLQWGDGIVDADPLFMDGVGGDYHLRPLSPCIDAGDPASDYSSEPMPNGGRINMGAYGNTAEATCTPGDIDGDGEITVDDAVLVYNALGTNDPAFDLDGDGVVTFADLRIVYEHIPPDERDFGGVSTLWALDYMDPTDPTAEGLDPTQDQSQLDNDGDDRTNYEEFVAGTDPTDPRSLLEITAVGRPGVFDLDLVSVSWSVVPGKSYQLYCAELPGGLAPWQPVYGIFEIKDGIATQIIELDPDTKRLFFKVEVW
jgi:hypothetical protein